MDILRNVFTSGISSRFFLTAVWILFQYIAKTKLLKDGWVQHVSLTTQGSPFVY